MTASAVYEAPTEVPLTGGLVALIDAEDFDSVSEFNWNPVPKGKTIYARTTQKIKGYYVYLHRMVLVTDAPTIDHINRNGLDNRKCNLRPATHSQNSANRDPQNRTGYKGVRFAKGKFEAQITANGRATYLGRFDDPVEAALAYDKAAKEIFGEYARTNF